jgi:hypothetical protein
MYTMAPESDCLKRCDNVGIIIRLIWTLSIVWHCVHHEQIVMSWIYFHHELKVRIWTLVNWAR